MKALVLRTDGARISTTEPVPSLTQNQLLVKITTAALNRRDFWCTKGLYPGMKYDVILGSDGCGVVVRSGSGSNSTIINEKVIINPSLEWGNSEECASPNFKILGMPLNGTFAEYIAVDASRVHKKPAHLSDEEAAALPLAGLTAYRAAFVKGAIKEGQKVLVPGIGSGVSTLVAQFAVAAGAKVWVTSSSNEKINRAIEAIGVSGGANYKEKDWSSKILKQAGGMFDVIVDGAGGPDFPTLVTKLLRAGGKLVTYGATAGAPSNFPIHSVFLQQKQIIGSTMGSDRDFTDMVNFVSKNKIKPLVDSVKPFSEILTSLKEMEHGQGMGKFVVKFTSEGNSKL